MKGLLLLYCFFILLFSCATVPQNQTIIQEGPLIEGDAGKGIRLAVIRPKSINIPKSQEWFLSMIQGSLTSDFNKFSDMSIIDRQHLDYILNEQELSLSGNFSDDDYISVGHLANAQYIVIGSLTKTGINSFLMELSITNTESGIRKASFGPKQFSLAEIQSMFAAKDATHDLLLQMGVKITAAGKQELYKTVQSTIDAETALAKGITAQNNGSTPKTNVETMYYLYEAQSFSPTLLEVSERLANISEQFELPEPPQIGDITSVDTGNIGQDARNKIAQYRAQKEYEEAVSQQKKKYLDSLMLRQKELISHLEACESFFQEHPPFEIVYDQKLKWIGEINYENETIDLSFELASIPTSGINTLWTIVEGLRNIDRIIKENEGTPVSWNPSLWTNGSGRKFDIEVALLNENEQELSRINVNLSNEIGGINAYLRPHNATAIATFKDINVGKISDTIVIKVLSINGKLLSDDDNAGYIKITAKDFSKNDYSDNGYNWEGFDRNGYNKLGYDSDGYDKEGRNELGYNRAGYNIDGYNQDGYNRFGYNRQGYNQAGRRWVDGDDNSKLFIGYVYAPDLPIGISIGGIPSHDFRLGLYFAFELGRPAHADLPTIDDPSNPIETGEDHFIDMVFGIYYRIVNNLFADVGIGSYGNSVYGLYKVRGSDEPVWCNIDGSDGVSSGFALQAGLLYSFRWIYISAGYRRYFSGSSTSTFYGGAGISINIPKKYFNK